MASTLWRKILNEPEAVTVGSAVATSQAICPGFCVSCAAPVGGAILGGLVVRVLRALKS